jgi:hypothetical protein
MKKLSTETISTKQEIHKISLNKSDSTDFFEIPFDNYVLYYVEICNAETNKLIDSFLRDENGETINDPVLFDSILNHIYPE